MHYVTVFDASTFPYRNLSFLLPGLMLLTVGTVMVMRPEWLEAAFRQPLKRRWFFRWFFFLFALTWTIGAGASILTDASNARQSMREGGCEGRVEHFHPMPWAGHDEETFDVNGIKFSYSDYIITAGFNNTASHGGPIRQGRPVRICERGNEILRLEVAR